MATAAVQHNRDGVSGTVHSQDARHSFNGSRPPRWIWGWTDPLRVTDVTKPRILSQRTKNGGRIEKRGWGAEMGGSKVSVNEI